MWGNRVSLLQVYDQTCTERRVRFSSNELQANGNHNIIQPVCDAYDYKKALLNGSDEGRREADIIYGTKQDVNRLAADAEIVIFGVAKNVTSYQVVEYAKKEGLKTLNCELLTKWDESRSNTFKLTIKAYYAEKALNNSL